VNGGKQVAYQASLIWNPTDYVRFMGQYSHLNVTGGPRVSITNGSQIGLFDADLTPPAINDRDFSSDVLTMRAQIDF
jgi:phosphate-selective porin OprO/OprP